MACESYNADLNAQQLAQAEKERKEKIAALEKLLAEKKVNVIIDPDTGAIAFGGWEQDKNSRPMLDACAIQRLMQANSMAFQIALAEAEAITGRSADMQAVTAGHHSHDGGKTWHAGH